jgi:hypothetical protein
MDMGKYYLEISVMSTDISRYLIHESLKESRYKAIQHGKLGKNSVLMNLNGNER